MGNMTSFAFCPTMKVHSVMYVNYFQVKVTNDPIQYRKITLPNTQNINIIRRDFRGRYTVVGNVLGFHCVSNCGFVGCKKGEKIRHWTEMKAVWLRSK